MAEASSETIKNVLLPVYKFSHTAHHSLSKPIGLSHVFIELTTLPIVLGTSVPMCEDQPGDWQINTMEEWWKHLIQSLDLVELAGRSVLRSSSAV